MLVYGELADGVSDLYRFGQFQGALAHHRIVLQPWSALANYEVRLPAIPGLDVDEAIALGLGSIEQRALDWADVMVFRRWYSLGFCCTACDTLGADAAGLAAHGRATGHPLSTPQRHLPVLWRALLERRAAGRAPAIVYDTDDDLFAVPEWTGLRRRVGADLSWLQQVLAAADLVTVSTPVLATRLAARTGAPIRVIRNALEPAWYVRAGQADTKRIETTGAHTIADQGVRIAYHGVARRLRDYAVARPAVDRVAARVAGTRRVWIGAAGDPAVDHAVDESLPFVSDPVAFAAALVAARPDIGLAPLVDEPYNQARSELHWLEYSLAGAATVATRTAGPGPYDVIRDGVDGLLARTSQDWQHSLGRLAASAALRADLAGRARERVLAESTVTARAPEWAAAYRAAAARRRAAPTTRPTSQPAARQTIVPDPSGFSSV